MPQSDFTLAQRLACRHRSKRGITQVIGGRKVVTNFCSFHGRNCSMDNVKGYANCKTCEHVAVGNVVPTSADSQLYTLEQKENCIHRGRELQKVLCKCRCKGGGMVSMFHCDKLNGPVTKANCANTKTVGNCTYCTMCELPDEGE